MELALDMMALMNLLAPVTSPSALDEVQGDCKASGSYIRQQCVGRVGSGQQMQRQRQTNKMDKHRQILEGHTKAGRMAGRNEGKLDMFSKKDSLQERRCA